MFHSLPSPLKQACARVPRKATSCSACVLPQPALRKHWHCPGCGTQMIGTHADIAAHIHRCGAALALPQRELEVAGYGGSSGVDGGGSGGGGNAPSGGEGGDASPHAAQAAAVAALMAQLPGGGAAANEASRKLAEYMGGDVVWGRRRGLPPGRTGAEPPHRARSQGMGEREGMHASQSVGEPQGMHASQSVGEPHGMHASAGRPSEKRGVKGGGGKGATSQMWG
eukprot:366369-Chlamydomonas_euryale.AAC.4